MTAAELEEEFISEGIRRGGVLLLPEGAALRLLHLAREAGMGVLGVDSFRVDAEGTSPLSTLDLSLSAKLDVWSNAEEFIASESDATHFEVVLNDQHLTWRSWNRLVGTLTTWEFILQIAFVVGVIAFVLISECWGG